MISVITPTYNIRSDPKRMIFFDKMLHSISNQTYKNVQHIVVDGASTDGTFEELKLLLKNKIIDILISEDDTGVYQAMNRGIQQSKGEYINIMNSDDYICDNDFFYDAINILEEQPNIGFTHGNKMIVSRDKGLKNTYKNGKYENFSYRMPFRHQSMVVRKGIFDGGIIFDEKLQIASDYKFVLDLILQKIEGYYFDKCYINALDGGLSSDSKQCIKEVSSVIYEMYGKKIGFTRSECTDIYIRKISKGLLGKIQKISESNIKKSLMYGIINGEFTIF